MTISVGILTPGSGRRTVAGVPCAARRRIRVLVLVMVWLAGPRAHADDDPAIQQALVRAADKHAAGGSAIPGGPWSAATVSRLAAWLQGKTGVATADDLKLLKAELDRPVALIISGAASLGSYQGGFLYYYLRHLTEARRLAERAGHAAGASWLSPGNQGSPLRLITGASSGSINAVIAAMTSCETPVHDPRQSLFWTTWIPVGGKQLTDAIEVQPDGLLSTQPIRQAVGRMQNAWEHGSWSPDQTCTVDLGLSATRTRARTVTPLDDPDLMIPRQSEQMMITLRGGPGEQPVIGRFKPELGVADKALFEKLYPRVGAPGREPTFADVTEILWASSAFSFAFPPHRLHLTAGASDDADDADYTDGGVFDNRPAGLAVHMQRWRLGVKGEADSQTRYIVQDPDITAWRPSKPPPDPASTEAPLFLDTWSGFASDFLDTTFTAELMNAIEREPTLYAGIEIPPRRVPVAGAYLMEFLSFVEQDFRVFDFFTGMVDAWEQLASTSLAFQAMAAANQAPTFAAGAPEFRCLLAWRAHDRVGAPPPGDDACAAVGQSPPDPTLRDNMLALLHASAATLQYSRRSDAKKGDPSDEQFFLRALGEPPAPGRAVYRFRELAYRGKPATSATITLAIRDEIQALIERTTFNQADGLGRFAVGAVGKSLANFYAYRPPTVFAGIGLSTERGFELEGGWRPPFEGYFPPVLDLRLDGVFRVLDLGTMTVDQPPNQTSVLSFAYVGAVHLTTEWQFQRWAPDLQAIAQFHTGFGWAFESLRNFDGPLLRRQGPELTVGASLLQRLTLEVSATWWQDNCAGNNHCPQASAALANRAIPLVDGSFALRFALGFRFYVN